jgi:hypothetical protein
MTQADRLLNQAEEQIPHGLKPLEIRNESP